jgi:hypothetical protein
VYAAMLIIDSAPSPSPSKSWVGNRDADGSGPKTSAWPERFKKSLRCVSLRSADGGSMRPIRMELLAEHGTVDGESKIDNYRAMGPAPMSVVHQYNQVLASVFR